MKANEAPGKIYLGSKQRPDKEIFYVFATPVENDDIEYTRNDTFIEKAEKWIDNFLSESTLIDYKVTPIVRNAVIENFKNYIKS